MRRDQHTSHKRSGETSLYPEEEDEQPTTHFLHAGWSKLDLASLRGRTWSKASKDNQAPLPAASHL